MEQIEQVAEQRNVQDLILPFRRILVGEDDEFVSEGIGKNYGTSLKYTTKDPQERVRVAFRLLVGDEDAPAGQVDPLIRIHHFAEVWELSMGKRRTDQRSSCDGPI